MLWFFEKHQSKLRYEIRRHGDGLGYELVITNPDGRQDIEVFRDSTEVVERSLRLHDTLIEAGWRQPRMLRRRRRLAL